MKIDFLGNHLVLLPELASLHHHEWKHLSPGRTLGDRVATLREMATTNEVPFIVVATEHDRLVASAALVLEDMTTRKDLSPWLASVFVKPPYRGRGIATMLVRHIEDAARALGIGKLFLYTEHARDLYARLGWRDLEQCDYQAVRVAIMHKPLSAQARNGS
jgi:N-acetylglutamate synthase-like GNAT family acetyltransferase